MSNPTDLVQLAKKLHQEGRLDAAAQAYAEALESDHENLEASLGLARIALALTMVDQATAILDRTLRFAPNDPQALVLRGLVEEGRGQLAEALEYFGQAAKNSPGSYDARYHRGRALAVARRYKDAIAELNAAARIQPAATDPHYAMGVAYRESGKIGESIAAFARTIEVDPTFLDGYMTLADILSEAGKQEMAAKVLVQAQSLFPDVGAVYDKLAAVYFKQGNLSKTVQTLQEQVRIEPLNEAAYVNLAVFALAAQDVPAAASAIDVLLRKDAKSWRGYHLRSMLYDMADKPEKAVADLREATRLAPQEWKPKNDLGTLLNAKAVKEKSAAAEAVQVLESASALAPPQELAPRYNLALAYWNAERRSDARRIAADLVRVGPTSHPVVEQAREVLAAMESAS